MPGLGSHVLRDVGRGPAASRGGDAEGLPDDALPADPLFGHGSIGLQHQVHRLGEVGAGFLKGCALGIGSRELFDEADVAFGNLLENGVELDLDCASGCDRI